MSDEPYLEKRFRPNSGKKAQKTAVSSEKFSLSRRFFERGLQGQLLYK